jgi:hypothetical protein
MPNPYRHYSPRERLAIFRRRWFRRPYRVLLGGCRYGPRDERIPTDYTEQGAYWTERGARAHVRRLYDAYGDYDGFDDSDIKIEHIRRGDETYARHLEPWRYYWLKVRDHYYTMRYGREELPF